MKKKKVIAFQALFVYFLSFEDLNKINHGKGE